MRIPITDPEETQRKPEDLPAGNDDAFGEEGTPPNEAIPAEEAPVESPLETALREKTAEAAQYLDQLKRTLAEFANYKRRTEQDLARRLDRGKELVITRLLELSDDFDIALRHREQADLATLRQGLEMLSQKFEKLLQEEGIAREALLGKPYDHGVAEALMMQHTGQAEAGTVIEELRPAYSLKGRCIRPGRVIVEAEAPEPPDLEGRSEDVLDREKPEGNGCE